MKVEEDGAAQLIKLFREGLDNRVVRSTEANETSSRSHMVFSLRSKLIKDNSEVIYGKLTFVDLAGSERPTRIGLNE
jgi:kinesin family protein 2/24